MTEFQIKLADRVIEIRAFYPEVYRMCQPYLCQGLEPDLRVTSSLAGIEYERNKKEGGDPGVSEAYLETLAVYRSIAEQMPHHCAFLMHGSAVAVGQEAYLFTAASGVGKTTRTTLWLDQIPGSYVVNGDKPLLKVTPSQVLVCGTPWSGKERLHTNTCVPLKAILLLERDPERSLRNIPFSEAFLPLLRQTYRTADPGGMARTLGLLKKLESRVACYSYHTNLEDRDMKSLYEAIR